MNKRDNSDKYKEVKGFFLIVFTLMAALIVFVGWDTLTDKASYQLDGTRSERVLFEEVKNSCINFIGMLK